MMKFSPSRMAFYAPEVTYADPPADLRDVDGGQYDLIMAGLGMGLHLASDAGGDPILVSAPETPLNEIKAAARAGVNAAAGRVRGGYITVIPGQEMMYLSKATEARAYLALAKPPASLAAFPLIAAEIGITAGDATGVCTVWMDRAAQWTQIAAQIEGARLAALRDIEAAQTADAVTVATAAFMAAVDP